MRSSSNVKGGAKAVIPVVTQQSPNTVERYWCGNCGAGLTSPRIFCGEEDKAIWKYCPMCGQPIEYEKAELPQWAEVSCERCGRKLIWLSQGNFVSTGLYIGGSICRNCMEQHCMQAECSKCKVGKSPGCRYESLKGYALRRIAFAAMDEEETN